MKRFLVLATILLIRSIPGLSQIPNNSIGTSDPDAKKILDAVTAKFKTYKTVKAEFTMNIEGSNGKLQASKKGLIYMKDTKYRVSLTGQEIVCDGTTVSTCDKSSKQVQRSR